MGISVFPAVRFLRQISSFRMVIGGLRHLAQWRRQSYSLFREESRPALLAKKNCCSQQFRVSF
jgi:hypothetical protein